ncbi:alpha-1,3-mannosyl-glycoprotein 4-beta-N-acetylglucosaminyltransferase C-like [Saccostrea echinata]|uniref:alpha-1,3-mannosyl-glycoprotein 4-beta-N-acetylglucosaminyltransferase C-like n=1 Tax=Saccostrea echinata TaxID=191078 RepID=UPI002A80276F|nr:alpha-1,3-mannosyl-glycoprotein 4-beta-N-acetylglucosaminyltransferase C-like [Saccostrea echinata]
MLQEGPDNFISQNEAEWSSNTMLFGQPKNSIGYLTIGIPVVKRKLEGALYVYSTISSIIKATTDREKENITLVIFLSDFDETWNLDTSRRISETFSKYIKTGFLQVIHSPLDIYPELDKKFNANFNDDSKDRTIWRSKQNIDFAYLMWYSRRFSQFYLQLEDDVVAANNFFTDIKLFIERNHKIRWITLEFSRLGFIGKLFRSKILSRFATYLLSMYNVLPCDILLNNFRVLHDQVSTIQNPKGLFQHIGKISSLRGKLTPITDFTFKDSFNYSSFDIPGENPPGEIFTNMEATFGSFPENAYQRTDGDPFFSVASLKANNLYKIVFPEPINISRIIVSTGHPILRTGILKWGVVKVGVGIGYPKEQCMASHLVGRLFEGEFDSEIQGYSIPFNVKCIAVVSIRDKPNLTIIRKIQVILDTLF